MGKPKTIDDSRLLELINQYYKEVCGGNVYMLKLPRIARYVASHGYPTYQVTTLRRNPAAREYIKSLLMTKYSTSVQDIIVYKPIDIEDFLNTNRTRSAQYSALSTLDNYYHTIADTSNALNQRCKNLEKKCRKLGNELDEANTSIKTYAEERRNHRAVKRELVSENAVLTNIVKNYVYPNIANELLKRDGDLVVEDTGINTEYLDKELVRPTTNINKSPEFSSGSNVIRGLFESLEEGT